MVKNSVKQLVEKSRIVTKNLSEVAKYIEGSQLRTLNPQPLDFIAKKENSLTSQENASEKEESPTLCKTESQKVNTDDKDQKPTNKDKN